MSNQPEFPRHDVTPGGRIVVLASGAGSTMAAVLRAQTRPAYGARIVAVISDVAGAGALVLAKQHGIATAVVSPAEFESRDAWNVALARTVQGFAPDIVLSAGFMRILGAPFLAQFGGRTVNTHPALLPSFPGAHAVRDAMTYGVKVTGCTLHVVDSGVDTGPIIAQVPVPVLDGDDQSTLHERIKEAERELLVGWMPRLARGFEVIQGRVHLPPFRGDTIE